MAEAVTKQRIPLAKDADIFEWVHEAPSLAPVPEDRDPSEPPRQPSRNRAEIEREVQNARKALRPSGDIRIVRSIDMALQAAGEDETVVDFIERHLHFRQSTIAGMLVRAAHVKADLHRLEEYERWWAAHERERRKQANDAQLARAKGKNSEAAKLRARIDEGAKVEAEFDRVFRELPKVFEARRARRDLDALKQQVRKAAEDQGVEPPELPETPETPYSVRISLTRLADANAEKIAHKLNNGEPVG